MDTRDPAAKQQPVPMDSRTSDSEPVGCMNLNVYEWVRAVMEGLAPMDRRTSESFPVEQGYDLAPMDKRTSDSK